MAKDVDFILVELFRGGMEPMDPDVWEAYANAYKAQEN